jgi:hypothetical protein
VIIMTPRPPSEFDVRRGGRRGRLMFDWTPVRLFARAATPSLPPPSCAFDTPREWCRGASLPLRVAVRPSSSPSSTSPLRSEPLVRPSVLLPVRHAALPRGDARAPRLLGRAAAARRGDRAARVARPGVVLPRDPTNNASQEKDIDGTAPSSRATARVWGPLSRKGSFVVPANCADDAQRFRRRRATGPPPPRPPRDDDEPRQRATTTTCAPLSRASDSAAERSGDPPPPPPQEEEKRPISPKPQRSFPSAFPLATHEPQNSSSATAPFRPRAYEIRWSPAPTTSC